MNIKDMLLYKTIFLSFDEYYSKIINYIKNKDKKHIVTANTEIFINSLNENNIKDILYRDYVDIVPDGISIVKAAEHFGIETNGRVTGVDIVEKLLYETQVKLNILIYGSSQQTIDDFIDAYNNKIKGIHKIEAYNGYDTEQNYIINKIINNEYDLILVALGVPKQELLISETIKYVDNGVFIGVGGAIDVISGVKNRSPKFFINNNLEWLYRILKEPKRINRFIKNNIKFFFEVYKFKK